MKRRYIFITFLLLLFLASCNPETPQEIVVDPPKVEESEKTENDVASAKIAISSMELTTRTILPDNDSLVKANWYEVTLTNVNDANLTYKESVMCEENGEGSVVFERVKVGQYSIYAEAYIKNGKAIVANC